MGRLDCARRVATAVLGRIGRTEQMKSTCVLTTVVSIVCLANIDQRSAKRVRGIGVSEHWYRPAILLSPFVGHVLASHSESKECSESGALVRADIQIVETAVVTSDRHLLSKVVHF